MEDCCQIDFDKKQKLKYKTSSFKDVDLTRVGYHLRKTLVHKHNNYGTKHLNKYSFQPLYKYFFETIVNHN